MVLNDVSMNCEAGELICLLGPSGCGKTTLLRLAAGLEKLQTGQVHIGKFLVDDAKSGNIYHQTSAELALCFKTMPYSRILLFVKIFALEPEQLLRTERNGLVCASENGAFKSRPQYPHTLWWTAATRRPSASTAHRSYF